MSNKRLLAYIGITLFCAIFSTVYEYFSHGVYSNFMVYLFAIPLLVGVAPELLGMVLPRFHASSPWANLLRHFSVATLSVGSALQGIVEIYGTTNENIKYYFVIGIGLLVASLALWLVALLRRKS